MKVILLAGILLLTSCLKNNSMSVAELDVKLSGEWMYSDKITGLKNSGEEITRPPGFEQLVLQLRIPQKGGLTHKLHCVYYLVGYKEKVSNLKVTSIKNVDSCPETSEKDTAFVSIDDLKNMKFTYRNYTLTMDFTKEAKAQKIEIPMPNIQDGYVHEKYKSLKEKSLFTGMKFLRLDDDSFDFASNRYLGKLSDRFSRGTAVRCHQVNKDCQTVGENRCDECRYGWFEVVDFQCPQGGSKFCGQNHCGEKNEPACPRGVKVVDPEDAGICQSDLEPVMNADKILVCQ